MRHSNPRLSQQSKRDAAMSEWGRRRIITEEDYGDWGKHWIKWGLLEEGPVICVNDGRVQLPFYKMILPLILGDTTVSFTDDDTLVIINEKSGHLECGSFFHNRCETHIPLEVAFIPHHNGTVSPTGRRIVEHAA